MASKGVIIDSDNYRNLSVPFASSDEANEAISAFQDELYALRNKYRIRDLLFVMQVPVLYRNEAGEIEGEGEPILVGHYGDELKSESIAGYAFGHMGAVRQKRTAEYVTRAAKSLHNVESKK